MYSDKILRIWFSMLFFNKQAKFAEEYNNFESIQEMYDFYRTKSDFIAENSKHNSVNCTISQAADIESFCTRNNIHILTPDDNCFPDVLIKTNSEPIVMYACGDLTILKNKKKASIVGARKADNYSIKVCKYFSQKLTENGYDIVSGFAGGIDNYAHKSCLEAGGKTIAVLGGGIMYDYPKGSFDFKQRVQHNGLLLSEYPPLERPQQENFLVRNRLIAAMSDFILVIQAGEKSGALNTVNHGLEYGKDIYVIPPSDIFSPLYRGQSMLIDDGATVACSIEDIIKE